jgi:hypothetical protein
MDLSLSTDICDIIADNFYTTEYVLEDWVANADNFSFKYISSNPNAIDFLKKNPQYINFDELSLNTNPEAIDLYINDDTDDYKCFHNDNYYALNILKKNQDKINWKLLSSNTSRLNLSLPRLNDNIDRINWGPLLMSLTSRNNYNWNDLSLNCKDIEFLQENQDEIVWEKISANPYALEILKKNQDKIDWDILSSNTNPEILKLFTEENLKKLKNPKFSLNIGACEFLKSHPQYITEEIGKMPYIFKKIKVFNESVKSVLNLVLTSS